MDEIKLKFCKNCGCDTERYACGKCKPCKRSRAKAHRAANKEKLSAIGKAYYLANKETILARNAEYRAAHPEKMTAYKVAWAAANPDKIAAAQAKYHAAHPGKRVEWDSAWRAANPQKAAQKTARWRSAHPEKAAAILEAWRKKNPHLCAEYVNRRRAAKLQATPAWANLDAIKAIYAETARAQRETGIPHDTDHIVPLQSPIVCGLHCEANLATITAKANREKSNRWWPDMPEPHPDMP